MAMDFLVRWGSLGLVIQDESSWISPWFLPAGLGGRDGAGGGLWKVVATIFFFFFGLEKRFYSVRAFFSTVIPFHRQPVTVASESIDSKIIVKSDLFQ